MSKESKSTMSLFVRMCIAKITGDDAEVKANKIAMQAKSALKTQIAANEGELEDLRIAVDEAKERMSDALVNRGNEINGSDARTAYVRRLIEAKNTLTDAEEAVEAQEELIAFLKDRLSSI